MPILEVEHISKSFNKTPVLKDVGFNLEKGQAVSIIGSSGSGKTTLLRCLNFLEHPDNGIIRVNGETLFDASVPATTQESVIRKKRLHFGLVFQNFNLFPQYTALENVMLAKKLLAAEQPDFKERKREILTAIEVQAKVLLTQMGLDNRMDNYPHQLSGGQCQRVAIARALALQPDILCFDEPTSALDPELTGEVLKVIRELADQNTTMIIVTHEMAFARDVADHVIFMDDGRIVELFVIPIAWFLRCLIKIAFTTSVYCLFVLFLTSPAFPFSLTFPLPHLILKSNDLRNEGNILCQNLQPN